MMPEKLNNEINDIAKKLKVGKDKLTIVVEKAYEDAKIQPGEAIGIVTAESFGEPSTQMILNVFHFSGVAEMSLTVGLPRLIEIFDARKNPSTPKMELPVRPKASKNTDMIRDLANSIKETKVKDLMTEINVNIAKKDIELFLDKSLLKEMNIKTKEVEEAISIALKSAEITADRFTMIIKSADKEIILPEIYKLKEKIKTIPIKGMKGITHILPMKEEGSFTIHTAGTNLKEALRIDSLDREHVKSNDLFETADVLGIEAARQSIINEALDVFEEQGLDVDIRHIMFLADVMTHNGNIKGVTRTGITGEKESVLARASFETPIKHIIKASLTGEKDELNSVVENVMLNQPVPLGTGLPNLIFQKKKGDKK